MGRPIHLIPLLCLLWHVWCDIHISLFCILGESKDDQRRTILYPHRLIKKYIVTFDSIDVARQWATLSVISS